jgi:hypothetical protein
MSGSISGIICKVLPLFDFVEMIAILETIWLSRIYSI